MAYTPSPVVEPKSGAAPAAPAVEPANGAPAPAPAENPEQGQEASLPPELIQIPAMQALIVGKPAALSASLTAFAQRPEGQIIAKNKGPLMNAGFGLYRSLSGDLGVVFNQLHINAQQLQDADKAGKILEVAPPFDEVNQAVGSAGANHPVLAPDAGVPGGAKLAAPAVPNQTPPQPANKVPPASNKLIGAKMRATAPGSPTSGPAPGSGRILNQILKPVI